MKTNRQEKILLEIQDLKRRLYRVERKAAALQKPKSSIVRSVLRKKYPHVQIDPQLLSLVGSDPPLSFKEEKQQLREAIADRFDEK